MAVWFSAGLSVCAQLHSSGYFPLSLSLSHTEITIYVLVMRIRALLLSTFRIHTIGICPRTPSVLRATPVIHPHLLARYTRAAAGYQIGMKTLHTRKLLHELKQ